MPETLPLGTGIWWNLVGICSSCSLDLVQIKLGKLEVQQALSGPPGPPEHKGL